MATPYVNNECWNNIIMGVMEIKRGMMNQTGIDDTNRQRVSGTSGNNGIQMVEKGPSASCRQVQ